MDDIFESNQKRWIFTLIKQLPSLSRINKQLIMRTQEELLAWDELKSALSEISDILYKDK